MIGDRDVHEVARKETADAVSRAAREISPGLRHSFPQWVALLIRLTDELEGVVVRQEDDALLSFTASRAESIALCAGYSTPDSISTLWNTASGESLSEAAAAKLLALTGSLASGDRRRSAQVVPVGAAQLLPGRPLRLVLGGVRLLGAVVEQSPELLPPNVLKALTDCLRWSGNEYVQTAVFELFRKAQIAERPIAVDLFEAMKEVLDEWLEGGCRPESIEALLRCARKQARGSSFFQAAVGRLMQKAAGAPFGEMAGEALKEFQIVAAWWPALEGDFLDSWLGAGLRLPQVPFPWFDDKLYWFYQFSAPSIRDRAGQVQALAEDCEDLRDGGRIAGLLWSFGLYDEAGKSLERVAALWALEGAVNSRGH